MPSDSSTRRSKITSSRHGKCGSATGAGPGTRSNYSRKRNERSNYCQPAASKGLTHRLPAYTRIQHHVVNRQRERTGDVALKEPTQGQCSPAESLRHQTKILHQMPRFQERETLTARTVLCTD